MVSNPITPAILYKRDGYNTQGQRLLGRHSAGEGFLKGLARYTRSETVFAYTTTQDEFNEFGQQISRWIPQRPLTIKWIPEPMPTRLGEAGLLYRPDNMITPLAWQRRFDDQRAYSLCGVTHTIASKETLREVGDFLLAPLQPWDAVICTSAAVKTSVLATLDAWSDYLAQRIGKRPDVQVQLPVIPLGVDCDEFALHTQKPGDRQVLRQRYGIEEDDIVVLFVGRLIFYAKAHPVPMYLALEQVAQATETKIHLIQAGWFEHQREEEDFKTSARTFCPSVNVLFVDGRQPEVRQKIWNAADMFISLAENIQETFGLTPIEAMAAGLPTIVTDWNGYQESVRDGIDGFRIPTYTPPLGSGRHLNAQYCGDILNYSTYVGHVAMATAVDVKACIEAITALIGDRNLRKRMGEAGLQRARSVYDWSVIIASYENLWQELSELRNRERMSVPLREATPPNPLCLEPFHLFGHYPTHTLTPETKLTPSRMATAEHLAQLRQVWSSSFGANYRLPTKTIHGLLQQLTNHGSQTVAEILAQFPSEAAPTVFLTLGYLLKFQVIEVLFAQHNE